MKIKNNLDYIIVLGAHVDGTRLSMALLERTRRALQYLENNPDTKAVLSGGQGRGEAVSEAKAMYDYLTGHGISRERLILEERSTNTKENLDFSLEMRMQRYLWNSIQISFLETSDLYSQGDSGCYQG